MSEKGSMRIRAMGIRAMGTIWGIFSPILIYYLFFMVISWLLSVLLPGLLLAENAMWFLAATNFCLLPIFFLIYRWEQTERALLWETGKDRKKKNFGLADFLLVVFASVGISRGINLLIGLTPLPDYFPGYRAASMGIYGCSLPSQVAASMISAALLEELLMRGLVYNRIKACTGSLKLSMIGSALIFGLFHGNVVQGLFAFLMGLFFVWVYERYQFLFPVMIAHMAVNGASIFCEYIKI